ncbi:cupin domain-containing protein [Allobranchiibius sp. GilTou38]|uniref:cupin domain-containing protein n=1 Tax=Allobranchiibius sp. GilTou38 TaxID=2815210 RepID=UPI001AA0B571|nr:cupin domain-containing protein [Allobranchiibius sp. GilTou38]MBO1766373.1 cupin domain-containing protein [Allobranchiibius sp. GilTou38]
MSGRKKLPDWAERLDLHEHPEGGWFRETYRSDLQIPDFLSGGSGGHRSLATAILYLLMPGEQSEWHRVTSDELWIHQHGGLLALELGGDGQVPDGRTTEYLGMGPALDRDFAVPQALVPAGHWQRASPFGLNGRVEPVLVSCVVTPGFDFADFELYDG